MSQHGRHSDRNVVELPSRLSRLIELRTFACFPSRQHTRINFPPDSKDRAVNSMEIFDSIKKTARSVLKPGKVVTIL